MTLPHLKSEGFVSSTTANDANSWEDDPCEEITEIVDYLLEASVVSHASLEFPPSAAAAAAIGYTLSKVYDVPWWGSPPSQGPPSSNNFPNPKPKTQNSKPKTQKPKTKTHKP